MRDSESSSIAQLGDTHGPDDSMLPFENIPSDAPSRVSGQENIVAQIRTMASELLQTESDFSWVVSAVRFLITSHPSTETTTAPLQRLLMHYNAFSAVSRLPAETLLNIFSHLVLYSDTPLRLANQSLLCVSAVCRFWRDIALSSPQLWSWIDLHDTDFAAVAFERSQNIPIHLKLVFPYRYDLESISQQTFTLIHEHAARIAGLHLTMPSDAHYVMLGYFPPELPLLHTLDLRNTHTDSSAISENEPSPDTDYLDKDTSIIHAAMPSLRTLKLENLAIRWQFRGLTTLHIDKETMAEAPSVETFLDVLTACPELEELLLKNAGPLPSRFPSTFAGAPVLLPKLRELFLVYLAPVVRYNTGRASFILSLLSPSQSARIQTTSFEPTARMRELYLTRFDTLRLEKVRIVFSVAGVVDVGHLGILMAGGCWEDFPHLPSFLRLPNIRTVVLNAADALAIGSELPWVISMLDVQELEVLRTEGMSVAAALETLREAEIGKLKKLEMVDVPMPGAQDGLLEDLRKLVEELEVRFVELPQW
ncbi:hypothetical protein DENSPDRAFT_834612 [Dentipellis sp. KUC8613]|nr:hypothetical protein DENSPDRAFT_834612 [Dentipellis sp. KUC8613]